MTSSLPSVMSLPGLLLIIFVHVTPPVAPVTMTPQIDMTPEHVTVVEGGRVILPCTVDMEDQPVIWVNPRKILISLDDRRMIDDHRISVERPYIKVWNLLIRTVRYNDSGIYECRMNTSPRQIKKVRLEVQVPPSILSQLSSDKVTVTEGDTATIICNVTGIPEPNVTWYKRNYRIIGGGKERIGEGGEILMIKNISRHCDDIYECLVDNGVPPAVSKAIRVIVEFSPDVVVQKPPRIGQSLHKETILECDIFANPQGVTTWMRHGRELQKMTNKYDVEVIHNDMENLITLALRIRDLTLSDYGPYECVGSNYIGEDRETMILYQIKPVTTTTTTTTTTPALVHIHPEKHYNNKNFNTHGFKNNKNNKDNYNDNDSYNHNYDNDNDNYDNYDDDNSQENGQSGSKGNNQGGDSGDVSNTDSRYDRIKSGKDADKTWTVFGADNNNNNGNGGDNSSPSRCKSSPWLVHLLLPLVITIPLINSIVV